MSVVSGDNSKPDEFKGKVKKKWTEEEEKFLRENYSLGLEELSLIMSRSTQSLHIRATELGLREKTHVWCKNIPTSDESLIVELYQSGLIVKQVCERTGYSDHQVVWCLNKSGLNVDRTRANIFATLGQKSKFSPEEQQEITRLWNLNTPIWGIASAVGRTQWAVSEFAKKHLKHRFIGDVLRNDGRKVVYSQEYKDEAVRMYTEELLSDHEVCSKLYIKFKIKAARSDLRGFLKEKNIDTDSYHRLKISLKMKEGLASGSRKISPYAGHGIKSPHSTPYQGLKIMRSTTEAKRADQLDSLGVVWFYEVSQFQLTDGTSYTPDFWITDIPKNQVLGLDTVEEIREFLGSHKHIIEDVKGWYNDKHPSKSKIDRFLKEYPEVQFHVSVQEKNGEFKWV